MGFLMQQNLTAKRLVVTLADDYAPHPTEGGHVIDMTIDSRFPAFVSPQTTAPDDLANPEQLPETDAKHKTYTYYVYQREKTHWGQDTL
jgi:hypothetical protein